MRINITGCYYARTHAHTHRVEEIKYLCTWLVGSCGQKSYFAELNRKRTISMQSVPNEIKTQVCLFRGRREICGGLLLIC